MLSMVRKRKHTRPPKFHISNNMTDEQLLISYVELVEARGWVKAQKELLRRKIDDERIRDTEQRALDFGYTYRENGAVYVDMLRWEEICYY
jgi:hypothetical protein